MTTHLVPFNFEGSQIRVVTDEPCLPNLAQDCVSALRLACETAAIVLGSKLGTAAASTLICIHKNASLATEKMRHALPVASTPVCFLNAAQLGMSLNISVLETNRMLAALGLQRRNERDEWELTDAGRHWAEAMPFSRNGHSGYQILWSPAVAEQMKGVA